METIFGLIVIFIVAGIIIERLSTAKTRKYKKPLSKKHRDIVENNFKLILSLPEEQQKKLEGLVNLFLEEKDLQGCEGLEIPMKFASL
ncbi:MAG: zinc-dependent peptidase [Lentisphaerales bacterium]|nr:zinc-dependent peptidase [Lentisphaerales bacterium]